MTEINKNANSKLFELVDKTEFTNADLEKIKSLLSEGADPNFRDKEYPNETVLYRVVSSWDNKKRLEIVKLLLSFGVNFNTTSDIFYPIDTAVTAGDILLVEFMLSNGVKEGIDYALKSAIEKDNIDLVTLLLKYVTNIHEFEPYSKSYLIFCSEAYRIRNTSIEYKIQPGIKMAELLIDYGIDPNGINEDASPMQEAIRDNFYELVDLLKNKGAFVKPEIHICRYPNTSEMFDFLVKKEIIKDLNEIILPGKQTPLIYHSMNFNFDIIKYLIENDAALYDFDKDRRTAFHYCLWTEDVVVIDYLLRLYDVKKCNEISSVFHGIDDKKIIRKLEVILGS